MGPIPFTMLINLAGLAVALTGAIKVMRGASSMTKREILDMLQTGWAGGDEGKIMAMASVIFTGSNQVQQGFKLLAAGLAMQLVAGSFSLFRFIMYAGPFW
jgi:hypothetical protein